VSQPLNEARESEQAQQNADGGKDPSAGPANGGPAPVASPDLEKRVAELEAQLKDKDAKYAYLYADLENFKKRAVRERADLLKYGWESAARELILVIDNLERALAHMPATTDKTLVDGLHLVIKQFRGTLEKQGVQSIESMTQMFDPNFHEAVAQESSETPEGTVIQEQQRGYTLHGRLLRPARVVISKGKS
jgi:molecular chaperone GrpE